MKLEHFEDVHPNWGIIENLSSEEANAALDLMLMAVYINDELTRDEVEVLTEEWLHLPFVGPPETADQLADRLLDTHSSLTRIANNPKLFEDFLDDVVDKVRDEDHQMAIYRMMVITASVDGFDEPELALCTAVGRRFGLEDDTIDDMVRSVWESRERGVDTEAGREHHIPPLAGARGSSRRGNRPHPNPFSTRL